jgi:DNA-binding transcriptional LysR family regulator
LTSIGEELFRVTDETLAQLDAVIGRIVGTGSTLAVTTTPALASLWLAPRLPRFNRAYPGIDVRVVASNDTPDLERDQLDIAIRFVSAGADLPDGERLFEATCFPVCAPELARKRVHPIRTPADLAHHVRLNYESYRDGRQVNEWDFWFNAMKLRPVAPASNLRFPQYDQLVAAAAEGNGVAIGVLPHVMPQLRNGVLCAPFGLEAVARRGTFFLIRRPVSGERDAVQAFASWLWNEVRRDGKFADAPSPPAMRAPRSRARRSIGRAQVKRG